MELKRSYILRSICLGNISQKKCRSEIFLGLNDPLIRKCFGENKKKSAKTSFCLSLKDYAKQSRNRKSIAAENFPLKIFFGSKIFSLDFMAEEFLERQLESCCCLLRSSCCCCCGRLIQLALLMLWVQISSFF